MAVIDLNSLLERALRSYCYPFRILLDS